MCAYAGNVGHLMQHWTLCKLLVIACRHNVPGLNFIDAHAMAPLATDRRRRDPLLTVRAIDCRASPGRSMSGPGVI